MVCLLKQLKIKKVSMQRRIKLQGEEINYNLRKNRRTRKLRLTIYCDGSLAVSAPRGLTLTAIENYILQKSDWVLSKLKVFKKKGENGFFSKINSRDYPRLKKSALLLAQKKVAEFNQRYALPYRRISIRNQKTRWGSCSKMGNLNYNYKITLLPERLADYIIVHELCHLQEFNHSRRFWDLVSQTIPDFKQRRKEIKNL
jgi:predicted metal-dependent hydrolase